MCRLWHGDPVLPPDSHVHTEWSWDAVHGSMQETCARAVELGLAAVAFTEHADYTSWAVEDHDLSGHEHLRPFVSPDGLLTPPPLDVQGYLGCLERCRQQFPDLRIVSGVELGEPHRPLAARDRLLSSCDFDLVLGSLHGLVVDGVFTEMPVLFRTLPADVVMRDYLLEVGVMLKECSSFSVLAHIDYPVRYWPVDRRPFAPEPFEDEFRAALNALASSGRALEVNTTLPLARKVVRWWREEGGETITFGSDAHDPLRLAFGFAEAAQMVEAEGFRPGRDPHDRWTR